MRVSYGNFSNIYGKSMAWLTVRTITPNEAQARWMQPTQRFEKPSLSFRHSPSITHLRPPDPIPQRRRSGQIPTPIPDACQIPNLVPLPQTIRRHPFKTPIQCHFYHTTKRQFANRPHLPLEITTPTFAAASGPPCAFGCWYWYWCWWYEA
ncbi:hypothetical protein L208DRAFT_1397658 [Tricholoma matsutake]|nr:hypothetical protein L208DRAFT_1397658 [Tricholoma matsutake 945]